MRMLDLLLVLNDLKTLTFFRGQVDLLYGANPLLGDGDRQLG